ncbi:hypothetical protein Rs2_28590 [Raphanus sativus]|nr:hypothetical protein Rs2_28590 [Raphanus sativus]
MANSYILLGDLKSGRCNNTAEVRLLRFWEARHARKGDLLSLDMLFLDEHSTLIQGSINSSQQLRFKTINPNYRLSDAPISIRFNDATYFDKLPQSVRPIPTELFRFRPYNEFLELANTGKQLPV